jgi:hypothetical protein
MTCSQIIKGRQRNFRQNPPRDRLDMVENQLKELWQSHGTRSVDYALTQVRT